MSQMKLLLCAGQVASSGKMAKNKGLKGIMPASKLKLIPTGGAPGKGF